jgi:hypothetical protein
MPPRSVIGLTLLLAACGGAPVPGISRSPDPLDAAQGDETPLRTPPPSREGGTDAPEPPDAPEAGTGPTEGGPEASPDAIAEEGGDSPGSLDGGEDAPAEASDSWRSEAGRSHECFEFDENCACGYSALCADPCGGNFCSDRPPSMLCLGCLMESAIDGGSCGALLADCDPDAG